MRSITHRRLSPLSIAGVLAIAIAVALHAGAAHAAPAAPATITRAGLTAADYQAAFTTYARAGMRLISVSGYMENGRLRYAGLWRRVQGPPQYARHGMTEADYTQELRARGQDGYTLVSVTPFGAGGMTLFNAIWEKRPSPPLLTRWGMTGAEYQAWFDDRVKAGMHPTQVSGYTIAGSARYSAIFEGGSTPAWASHHGLSSADLDGKIALYSRQGYRLKQLSGYLDRGQDRFAAIWERPGGGPLHARWAVSAAALQRVGDVERLSGWSPTSIQGYAAGVSPRFTMLLETPFRSTDLDAIAKAVTDGMATQKVAGASVAIAKDGRLLYAAGYGKANLQTGELMDVRHRLRIGSISKMITSAAVYKLVEDGLLSDVDRTVFGPRGILDADVKLPATMKSLEGATIRQFLQHLSGLPGANAPVPAVPDPVNCNAGGAKGNATLTARIQDTLTQYAKKNALLGKPGEYDSYSNMSHIIAEAVIEKVSGRSYLDYVRSRVLAPAGLATAGSWAPALFTIGDFTGANATSGEAGHYLANGAYAAYAASSTCENEPPGVGAGGWAMSAVDLLRWFSSIDGKPGRVPELLLAGNQRALTTAGVPKFPSGGAPYASGIVVNGTWSWCGSASTAITMGHNGGLSGATSDVWLLPNGFSLAVIVNQDSAGCTGAIVRNLVEGPLKTVDWPDHDQF